jgi:CRP-like cAMP-binding protein
MQIKKKKLLLKEGAICNNIYFIRKGVVRGFTFEGQREITTWISADNELVTSIQGLDERVPSLENIQAIEDCDLLMLSFEQLHWLYEHYPEFNIVGRKLVQRYYGDAERRAHLARLNNTEDKYRCFLERHEDLATRVPLKYIASYIGVTLETLSRVRRRFARVSGAGEPVKTKKKVDRSQIIY